MGWEVYKQFGYKTCKYSVTLFYRYVWDRTGDYLRGSSSAEPAQAIGPLGCQLCGNYRTR
jgi:hypothetical protein